MYEYNYHLRCGDEKELMDFERLMPGRLRTITLSVLADALHDGRLWKKESIEESNQELIKVIMDQLLIEVKGLVERVDPFAIHR